MKIQQHTSIDSNEWHGRVDIDHQRLDDPDTDIEEIDIDIHWETELRRLSPAMFEINCHITSIKLKVTAYNVALTKWVHVDDRFEKVDLYDWDIEWGALNALNCANGISNIELDYKSKKITLTNF